MEIKFPTQPKCGVVHCGNPQVAKGLCEKHYKRQLRHGTVSDEVGKKTIEGVLFSRHPLYETWRSITRVACGRLVCERWKDFGTFVADAGAKPVDAYALRRINTELLFAPDNIRWALRSQSPDKRLSNSDVQKAFRKNNPEYNRSEELRKKYGITLDQYNIMLADQNGTCAICKKPEVRTDKRLGKTSNLAVDHCHSTGKVRGLLCHKCNAMLGHSEDSVERLLQGAEYLRKSVVVSD